MDGALIGGIVAALTGCVPATIGALALLRKAMQPDMEARRWVQSVIDLVAAGVVHGIPLSVLARGRRILEADSDDGGSGPQEHRPAVDDRRRPAADDDRDPGDLRSLPG